jgi:hypothetical protein
MALDVGFDVSLENMQDWKGIMERGGKLIVPKLM